MPEQITPACVVIVDYTCDKCGAGTMQRTDDYALMSMPLKYWHACTACGDRQIFTTSYPTSRIEKETES